MYEKCTVMNKVTSQYKKARKRKRGNNLKEE